MVWAIAGGIFAWVFVDLRHFLVASGGAVIVLVGFGFLIFNGSALWLPLVPAGLALGVAAMGSRIVLRRDIWRSLWCGSS